MKKLILSTLAIAGLASMAAAVPLLTEDFNFTGDLSANGWVAHSGAATAPINTTTGLTYVGYSQSAIGNAALVDDNGEDVNRLFAPQTSGSVYVSFMFNAPIGSTVTEGYFFTMGQQDTPPSGTMNTGQIRPKIFLTTDGTGDYEIGFQYASNTITNKTALNLALGTTYLAVVKYTFNAGVNDDAVNLYVFTSGAPPVAEPGSPTLGPIVSGADTGTDLTNVPVVAIRQYNAAEEVIIDGIRVDTVWPLNTADVSDWSMY